MEEILNNLGANIGVIGYLIVFFYSLGGGFVALLAAGILSGSGGGLNIFICIFTAGLANFIGSNLLLYLARFQKNEVMKYFKKHRRKLALAHIWIKKYGIFIIFLHKYLYGIKTIIPLAIGFSKYDLKKFLIYNLFSSFIWAILIGVLSFVLGDGLKRLYMATSSYIFPVIGIGILIIFLIFLSFMARKKQKS